MPSGLIEQGVFQGHVRVHESANRTQIYHVGAKPFFGHRGGRQPQSAAGVNPFR